jgi:uncharacterized FlaG/YvyC family protein
MTVRRFFCDNPDCERTIFAERMPSVLAPYARRTQRLTHQQIQVAFALGGEAGAEILALIAALERQSEMRGNPPTANINPQFQPIPRTALKVESVDFAKVGKIEPPDPREQAQRVRAVIDRLNPILHNNTALSFRLHETSGRFYVQIVDRQANQVIQTLPTQKFLDHAAATHVFSGFVVDAPT